MKSLSRFNYIAPTLFHEKHIDENFHLNKHKCVNTYTST